VPTVGEQQKNSILVRRMCLQLADNKKISQKGSRYGGGLFFYLFLGKTKHIVLKDYLEGDMIWTRNIRLRKRVIKCWQSKTILLYQKPKLLM